MAVAFLQTLLEMVNKEMAALGKMKKEEEGKRLSFPSQRRERGEVAA
jgi:hypothetical protein